MSVLTDILRDDPVVSGNAIAFGSLEAKLQQVYPI